MQAKTLYAAKQAEQHRGHGNFKHIRLDQKGLYARKIKTHLVRSNPDVSVYKYEVEIYADALTSFSG